MLHGRGQPAPTQVVAPVTPHLVWTTAPHPDTTPGCRVEKNWGFLEDAKVGELHILYSTLPCTAVYRYNGGAPAAAVLVDEHCYLNSKLVRCMATSTCSNCTRPAQQCLASSAQPQGARLQDHLLDGLFTERCSLPTCTPQIGKRTGLNATDSRQSGNPVRWQAPDGHTRLLAMVHSRAQMDQYAHWLVRPCCVCPCCGCKVQPQDQHRLHAVPVHAADMT